MIDPKLQPMAYIIDRVAREWNFTPDDLTDNLDVGGNYTVRVPPRIVCRHVAMLLVWELQPHRSGVEVGNAFKRNRTTVLSNIEKARKLIERSLIIRTRYEALRDELKLAVSPILNDGSIALRRGWAHKNGLPGSDTRQPTLAE